MDGTPGKNRQSIPCYPLASFAPLAFAGANGVAAPPRTRAPDEPEAGQTQHVQSASARKTVLHVGCGFPNPRKLHDRFRGPDWKEIRLDIDPCVSPDIVATMIDMQEVHSDQVDAVWSSHNLEHLEEYQVPLALKEFLRVLKPRGLLLITLPDLLAVARTVVEDKLTEPVYISPSGPIRPIDIIFGHSASIANGNGFMAHRTGFTPRSLAEALREAGFECVEVESTKLELWATAHKPG